MDRCMGVLIDTDSEPNVPETTTGTTTKMAGQEMPKVDMAKEFAQLSESDKHFVRKLEGMNKERAVDVKKIRARNKYTGLFLGASVLGIYFYSMYAVRQEKFLDFEEVPEKKQ